MRYAENARSGSPPPRSVSASAFITVAGMNLEVFTPSEVASLEASRGTLQAPWTVAYCVWENPYAKSGGIGAVARDLPPALAAAGAGVIVISPWHSRLKTAHADLVAMSDIEVPFGGRPVRLRLLETRAGAVRRVYLDAPGHFTADGGAEGKDPYIYSHDPCATADDCSLLRDSLLACAAVPHALAALGATRNVIVHAQDWQFASVALTTKLALLQGFLQSAAVFVTSHNPYDHQLSPAMLGLITDRTDAQLWNIEGQPAVDSVCAHMLPLADGPISTVSRTFARELTSDPLLSTHFTPHLQRIYRVLGVVGIPNGRFGKPPSVERAKLEKRRAMLEALAAYRDPRQLGRLDAGVASHVPVFFTFGRFDPGQKGFDVLARAIEAIPPGMARFILAPQARDMNAFPADRPFLADLARLASARPGEVVVYPFQMEPAVYGAIMQGASYAVMPSLYEPFGAATEPYLAGTPVVARATGGLADQVEDMATGLLYREATTLAIDPAAEWKLIESALDPADRLASPLYAAMTSSLAAALMRAIVLYSHAPETYQRFLANLPAKAAEFDWTAAAHRYLDWYASSSAMRASA